MASSTPPKYLQIAAELRSRITSGRYPIDSYLPTKKELETEFDVAQSTVDNALDELELDKLIKTQQGKRTTVISDVPARSSDEQPASLADILVLRDALIDLYEKTGQDYPQALAELGGTSEGSTEHEKPA